MDSRDAMILWIDIHPASPFVLSHVVKMYANRPKTRSWWTEMRPESRRDVARSGL